MSSPNPSNSAYIYALCDPETQEVHYVGQTKSMLLRFSQHVKDKTGSKKAAWVRSLKEQHLVPAVRILEKVSQDQANAAELKWLKHFVGLSADLKNTALLAEALETFRRNNEPQRQPGEPIRLYTLAGLAEELSRDEDDKVGVDYLNKLVIKYKKGEKLPHRWQGYKFIQVGSSQRGVWLVSKDNADIEIIDAPAFRKDGQTEASPE